MTQLGLFILCNYTCTFIIMLAIFIYYVFALTEQELIHDFVNTDFLIEFVKEISTCNEKSLSALTDLDSTNALKVLRRVMYIDQSPTTGLQYKIGVAQKLKEMRILKSVRGLNGKIIGSAILLLFGLGMLAGSGVCMWQTAEARKVWKSLDFPGCDQFSH
jgi:hypothetical protein